MTRELLGVHRVAPETRLASSLSAVEIFVVLYYGGILRFDPRNTAWEGRDRFIISKGHGAISMYPILADLGFFDKNELTGVCREGSFLGGIPDPIIPGFETVNGSLGHGIGVGCGMAVALKRKKSDVNVFVLTGDGELYEGSNWEALMFAGHHGLDNVTLIVDFNKICMLGRCSDIIDLAPLAGKLAAFGWDAREIDGHDIASIRSALEWAAKTRDGRPKAIVAHTIKGHGSKKLEESTLSHVLSLTSDEIDELLGTM